MTIEPMLDEWVPPRIERIEAIESRRLAEHSIPGLNGSLHQDLGHHSLRVEIVGSLVGEEARDTLFEELRARFLSGEPVDFVADIVNATNLEQVLIESLEVEEKNDFSDAFRYRLVLRQYVEPPPPAPGIDDFGLELDAELDGLADLSLDGLELPELMVSLPSLGDPVTPTKPALDAVRESTAPLSDILSGLRSRFE